MSETNQKKIPAFRTYVLVEEAVILLCVISISYSMLGNIFCSKI